MQEFVVAQRQTDAPENVTVAAPNMDTVDAKTISGHYHEAASLAKSTS
jgi:hypothetical protein